MTPPAAPARKPPWLKIKLPAAGAPAATERALGGQDTVCAAARCPNRGQCFAAGEATFLILGPSCTRACAFCAVPKGRPAPPDPGEPARVAAAAGRLGLAHVVLTMVSRDDLADGGASQVAAVLAAVRAALPGARLEALISDLGGDDDALDTVLAAGPEVLNHNLETVPRLYPAVRPQADYRRSLRVLARSAAAGAAAKSGLMLGLGETADEVLAVMDDLKAAGCRFLTLGQYLAPSPGHHPVAEYVTPERFDELAAAARARGFAGVASGPLVRSSFEAGKLYRQGLGRA